MRIRSGRLSSRKGGLSSSHVTEVLVSMMRAAGFDPETHVKEPDEEARKDEAEEEDGIDKEEVLAEMVFQVVTDDETYSYIV